ncbi:hypothetical protein D3C87_2080530 [compost metagenome]
MHEAIQLLLIYLLFIQQERQRHILLHRQNGNQIKKLIDQADLPASEDGQLRFV